ncbi:hypothetical protein DFH06DRAFT_1466259 [Mycena polygramma]|nr:hypothetical protein DFH06DRAFT_1466259 [Mycena polygramma]
MSFFPYSSIVIHDSNFYAPARDVNIQNEQQFRFEASESNPEVGQGGTPLPTGLEGFPEEDPVVGPVRNTRAEARMLYPYSAARLPSDQRRPPYNPSFPFFDGTNDSLTSDSNTAENGDGTPLPSNPLHSEGGAYAQLPYAYSEPTTTIHNGTFIGEIVHNTVRHGESGITILHRGSAPEAFHDSPDSPDRPRCHAETRIEIHQKLLKWCLDLEWRHAWGETSYDTEPSVLWLHGPAGAGKSAIMRTLSQRLETAGRLGGAFFFKRGHATCGNAKVLFVTVALQLAVNSAQLKPRILRIVEETPTLVGRSISVQLRELLLRPCIGLEDSSWTIIIDGLDECEGHCVQQEILRMVLHSTRQPTPLRFIIASRPEAHIREVLDEASSRGLHRSFNMESCFDDVRRYLVAEFARIHCEHKTMANLPRPWPSEEVIDHLVHKSSGYFIYASTVIKFVDDRYFRPTQRLELVHRTRSSFDSPFGALDEIYTHIPNPACHRWPPRRAATSTY